MPSACNRDLMLIDFEAICRTRKPTRIRCLNLNDAEVCIEQLKEVIDRRLIQWNDTLAMIVKFLTCLQSALLGLHFLDLTCKILFAYRHCRFGVPCFGGLKPIQIRLSCS